MPEPASAREAAAHAVVVVGTSDRGVSRTTPLAPRSASGFCTTAASEIGQRENPRFGGDVAYVTTAPPTPRLGKFTFIFDDLKIFRGALNRREQRL